MAEKNEGLSARARGHTARTEIINYASRGITQTHPRAPGYPWLRFGAFRLCRPKKEKKREKKKGDIAHTRRGEITAVISFFFDAAVSPEKRCVTCNFRRENRKRGILFATIRLQSAPHIFEVPDFGDRRVAYETWINKAGWAHFDLVCRDAVLSQVNHVYPVTSRRLECYQTENIAIIIKIAPGIFNNVC